MHVQYLAIINLAIINPLLLATLLSMWTSNSIKHVSEHSLTVCNMLVTNT